MKRNVLNLPLKEPDGHCNARTPKGYCKNKAGFRTVHLGEGRCWLHGGNTPARVRGDAVAQAIYTRFLPTTLAIELAEIKNDPLFSTLFHEFSVMKLVVEGLIKHLPEDISSVYGRLVCSECKKDLSPLQDGQIFVFHPVDAKFQQKRLDKIISTIESMSRVFEKISKHEERQKRFIAVSELEGIMAKWGNILMKYFGEHENIKLVQQEIMESGFVRRPGEQDQDRLDKFRTFQRSVRSKAVNNKKQGNTPNNDVFQAISDIDSELIQGNIVMEQKTVLDAQKILRQVKSRAKCERKKSKSKEIVNN